MPNFQPPLPDPFAYLNHMRAYRVHPRQGARQGRLPALPQIQAPPVFNPYGAQMPRSQPLAPGFARASRTSSYIPATNGTPAFRPGPSAIEPWNNPPVNPRPYPHPIIPPPTPVGGGTAIPPGSVPPPIGNWQGAPPPPPQTGGSGDFNGRVYRPKPGWWVHQQSAYRPIVFPGVETSNGTRTKYQDGSVVDYASLAWQRASAFRPPTDLEDLWRAIPDSWIAEMAGWSPSYVKSYLDAVSRGAQGGMFNGKYMSGIEAAEEIKRMAREAAARAAQANKPQPVAPPPSFQRPSPYVVK